MGLSWWVRTTHYVRVYFLCTSTNTPRWALGMGNKTLLCLIGEERRVTLSLFFVYRSTVFCVHQWKTKYSRDSGGNHRKSLQKLRCILLPGEVNISIGSMKKRVFLKNRKTVSKVSFFRSKLPNLVCLFQPRAERPLQAPELRRHLRRDRRHLGGLGPVRRLPAPGVGQIRLRGDAGEEGFFSLLLDFCL